MNVSLLAFAVIVAVVLIMLIRHAFRVGRDRKLRVEPPPESWSAILDQHFTFVQRLSDAHKAQLFGAMHLFLNRIRFEGCGGQEITEEIKVTIAAQACLLLIGREHKVYPRLKTVLVYPHTYTSGAKGMFGGDNGESSRLGESWTCGVVVLSWNSVVGGARNLEDGHNVTLHEFAHQLDQEDGVSDGAPLLDNRSAYVAWGRILSADYDQLRKKTKRGKCDVIDDYGATNPAEFFAVSTETFFEKPKQLQDKHPDLYEELRSYYKVNPLDWVV